MHISSMYIAHIYTVYCKSVICTYLYSVHNTAVHLSLYRCQIQSKHLYPATLLSMLNENQMSTVDTLHSCTPVFLIGLLLGLSTSPSPCSGPSCSTPVHYFIAQQAGSCPRLEGKAVSQSNSITV